jgi:hypothetical protein
MDFNLDKNFVAPVQNYHLAIKKCNLLYPFFDSVIDIFFSDW